MIVADFAHLGNHLFEIPVLCIRACTSRHGNRFYPIKITLLPNTRTHTHTTTVRPTEQTNKSAHGCWFWIIQAIHQCDAPLLCFEPHSILKFDFDFRYLGLLLITL